MVKLFLTILDWVAVAAGMCIGVLPISVLGLKPWDGGRWAVSGLLAFWAGVFIGGSWIAARNRRRAAMIFLTAAIVGAIVCVIAAVEMRRESTPMSEMYVVVGIWLAPPLILGLFWLGTYKSGRLPMLTGRRSQAWRLVTSVAIAGGLLTLTLVCALFLAAFRGGWNIDCSGRRAPSAVPRSPDETVFTARSVYFCCEALTRRWPSFGGFAVAVVGKRFWGLPWWNPGVVFLVQDIGPTREPLFVDGEQRAGVLRRIFSIIQPRVCGRTTLLRDAQIDLRVLHDGPPRNGVRIIGEVQHDFVRHANVAVVISGPTGGVTVKSDADGIYDISGLPAGAYEVHLATVSDTENQQASCGPMQITSGGIGGCTLRD